MTDATPSRKTTSQSSLFRSIGPALITACVVFGPGSLLVSSKIGATYSEELLWLLVVTAVLMGTFLTMGARIGVVGGATPCTLIANRAGRVAAAVIGMTLCLICTTFQFSNNLAVVAAARAFFPPEYVPWILVGINGLIILFLFTARQVYQLVERGMKLMVAVILLSFLFNLLMAQPDWARVMAGLIPHIPDGLEIGIPHIEDKAIVDPMILIAGLLGTTFSVAGAFYQGNLVRERGWNVDDYQNSVKDALVGVSVLMGVSMMIMITTATVIPGKPAEDIGTLATSLQPLLGSTAYWVFCIGLFAVAMNPFLINAMIGGSILADAVGLPPKLKDRWPRLLTVAVMLIGMAVALAALQTGEKPIRLIIFGQALTVLGNPLMAAAMLWLANRRDVMGDRRNTLLVNLLGGIGFLVVLLMAARVVWRIVLELSK